MSLAERIELYRRVEELRSHPLLVFVTSSRPNAPGLMASDAIPEFLDQMSALTVESDSIDLLIVSNGGDPTVAWRIMSLLRERFKKVSVLIPQAAFSAATLLALGADEIVMHPHGNLGPVDPQLTTPKPNGGAGEVNRYGYEELQGFFEFAKQQGIKDQEQLRQLFSDLAKEVGAIGLGYATRGSRLIESMGEQLLRMHMTKEGDEKRAKDIAGQLQKNFAHHGYPLSRKEAKELGLKVAGVDPILEDVMWKLWLNLESELAMRIPFNPVDVLASHPSGQELFAPVTQVAIPNGLPPEIAQQVYQNVLGQIGVRQIEPVPYEIIHAVLESTRLSSRSVTRGRILASRLPDGQLQMNIVTLRSSWESAIAEVATATIATAEAVEAPPVALPGAETALVGAVAEVAALVVATNGAENQ